MSVWADNPQAVQIDALIVRVDRLTGDECDRLTEAAVRARFEASAGAAAGDAAGDAARDAAWFAAGATARVAAGDAAGDAAGFAAWFAAGAAAGALVVRDLINENTAWNQAAYDLLTGPWRRAIGPVHPDDEVLR